MPPMGDASACAYVGGIRFRDAERRGDSKIVRLLVWAEARMCDWVVWRADQVSAMSRSGSWIASPDGNAAL